MYGFSAEHTSLTLKRSNQLHLYWTSTVVSLWRCLVRSASRSPLPELPVSDFAIWFESYSFWFLCARWKAGVKFLTNVWGTSVVLIWLLEIIRIWFQVHVHIWSLYTRRDMVHVPVHFISNIFISLLPIFRWNQIEVFITIKFILYLHNFMSSRLKNKRDRKSILLTKITHAYHMKINVKNWEV